MITDSKSSVSQSPTSIQTSKTSEPIDAKLKDSTSSSTSTFPATTSTSSATTSTPPVVTSISPATTSTPKATSSSPPETTPTSPVATPTSPVATPTSPEATSTSQATTSTSTATTSAPPATTATSPEATSISPATTSAPPNATSTAIPNIISTSSDHESSTETITTKQPKPEPLQILKMSEKKFTLMKEELEKILMREDTKDSPVAVVSIAGAFRGGKSFMLDYFLRYLQASPEKRKDGTWIGDKEQPLSGFSWRGGSERNTLGVLMWSEPYFVTMDDGTKVLVLVVDTQGIFDSDSTVADCSTIFAFATLISSLVIFNVRDNIKEDDLSHLHLFSKFGELVKSKKGKIYQNLEFLVRDFPYPDEIPYGPEGGQELVNRRFAIKEGQSQDLQDVRRDILASYEKISGFLMPHPGFGVFDSKYDGRWSVLTEDFKTYLHVLVDSIFSPSTLVPRKISNMTVTGKDLFFYITSFMEVFESAEMPTLKTIARATIEAILRLAFTEAREYYQRTMEAQVGASKPGMSPYAVNDIHLEVKKAALEKFLSKQTMADDKDVEPYLATLKQDLESQLRDYLIINHVKLQKAIEAGNEAYKAYIKGIHNDDPLCLTPEDLKEAHDNAVTAGRRAFDSNRRPVDGIPDEERDLFLKNLEANLINLQSKNNLNTMAYLNEILLSYNEAMDEYIKDHRNPPASEEKLESFHLEQLKKAQQSLDSKRNYIHNTLDEFKSSLINRISDSYVNYRNVNRIRNSKALKTAYAYFTEQLDEFWNTDSSYYKCVPPHILKQKYEDYKERALKKLRDENTCTDRDCLRLSSLINSYYTYVENVNDAANQSFVNKAYRIYRNYMDENTAFTGWWVVGFGIPYLVNKGKRSNFHEEAKTKAYDYFGRHRVEDRWDSYYDELNDRMRESYYRDYE